MQSERAAHFHLDASANSYGPGAGIACEWRLRARSALPEGAGVPLRPLPVGVVPTEPGEKVRAGMPAKTATIRPMGRRSLLSPEYASGLSANSPPDARRSWPRTRAGIGRRTLERWIAQGRVRRPERPVPPEDESWRIAASLLERTFPERWGAG